MQTITVKPAFFDAIAQNLYAGTKAETLAITENIWVIAYGNFEYTLNFVKGELTEIINDTSNVRYVLAQN